MGDLVQIDGSPHDWFEGRGPLCTLIVYVDDATTRLMASGFFPAETTEAYMETTRAHLAACGRPVAYYSDRYGVFRVNKKGKENELTQFGRALKTLDIASIHAGSPQAKGRVERANRTLQDRLVKEMRLRGIDGMAAGNAYLPEFMADFNGRFAVAPRDPADAHRKVLHETRELDLIFSEHHVRKLTKNLSIRFECREYQVTGRGQGYRLRGAAVTVCEAFDGSVTVLHDGRELPVRLLAEGEEAVSGGGRKDDSGAGGPGQGGTAIAPGLQAGAGSPLAAAIEAASERGRRRMKAARIGLGLRSLRSLRPRPMRPRCRCSAGDGQRGHFCFGEKGTFLLCVYTRSPESSTMANPNPNLTPAPALSSPMLFVVISSTVFRLTNRTPSSSPPLSSI